MTGTLDKLQKKCNTHRRNRLCYLEVGFIIKDLPEFLQAFFLVTIKVAAIGAICALVLGVLFGLLSSSRHKIIRFISRCYVELFQNTPVLIQVFFVYIGLPYLGFNLDSTIIAVIIISFISWSLY